MNVANAPCVSFARVVVTCFAAVASACARTTSGADAQPTTAPALPITSGDYPAYGHASDFTWVAGKIVRSFPAGQCTYVAFATRPGEPWGGRIALDGRADDVARFPDDDMVVVTGTLDARSVSACGLPALRVQTIEEH